MSTAVMVLALVACGPYPRDIEGTAERVRDAGLVRIAFAELEPRQRVIAEDYAARLAAELAVRVQERDTDATEALFAQLEDGQLDLVIAEVATGSPWRAELAVLEPLARRRVGGSVLTVSPVARNGENEWIGLLEREARDMAAGQ